MKKKIVKKQVARKRVPVCISLDSKSIKTLDLAVREWRREGSPKASRSSVVRELLARLV